MRYYGISNGYKPIVEQGEDELPAKVVVTLSAATDDDVDPHEVMRDILDAARDLIRQIHATTDCGLMDESERNDAVARMFMGDTSSAHWDGVPGSEDDIIRHENETGNDDAL